MFHLDPGQDTSRLCMGTQHFQERKLPTRQKKAEPSSACLRIQAASRLAETIDRLTNMHRAETLEPARRLGAVDTVA